MTVERLCLVLMAWSVTWSYVEHALDVLTGALDTK